jgi:hypothetical protein
MRWCGARDVQLSNASYMFMNLDNTLLEQV